MLNKETEKEDPSSKDVSSWTGLERSGQDHIGRIYEIRHILNPNRWCCKISLRFCIILPLEKLKIIKKTLKHHEVHITPNFQRIQNTRNIRKSLPQLFLCEAPYASPSLQQGWERSDNARDTTYPVRESMASNPPCISMSASARELYSASVTLAHRLWANYESYACIDEALRHPQRPICTQAKRIRLLNQQALWAVLSTLHTLTPTNTHYQEFSSAMLWYIALCVPG